MFENELFFHVQFLMFRTGGLLAAGALGCSVSLLGHPGSGGHRPLLGHTLAQEGEVDPENG